MPFKPSIRTWAMALLVVPLLLSAGVAFPSGRQVAHPRSGDRVPADEAWHARHTGIAPSQRDVAYGRHPLQHFDVYAPRDARHAPVIVLVHGGGWTRGDKASGSLIAAKVARWVPRGFVVISTNYRMQPDAAPREQAADVARAVAVAQSQVDRWGGDPDRFILMGHSAGAHLVSLLTADRDIARREGARPWLGTVALDSAAFDVMAIMSVPHPPLYDTAFGEDPTAWTTASPLHAYRPGATPLLAVCSTERSAACAQARAYAARAARSGDRVEVVPLPLSHRAINVQLGEPGAYTDRVEAFMRTLDAETARHLERLPAARMPAVDHGQEPQRHREGPSAPRSGAGLERLRRRAAGTPAAPARDRTGR